MRFLNVLAYWFGAAILSLCLVPLLLVAMMIGLGAWLISRLKAKRVEATCLALLLLAVGGGGCGRDAAAWWQFPVERREFSQHTPPSPPFAETNAPSADVEVSVEIPRQGAMTPHQFAALQKCLAQAIAPHATPPCATIEEAVDAELVRFWKGVIQKSAGKPAGAVYGIYELEARIVSHGPDYVSYRIECQDGCPCCMETTNVVWCWRTEAPLRIDDIIEPSATNELKRLMRQRVVEDFRPGYGDDYELPDYAKDWPQTFGNFSLDAHGVTWFCDAGDVLIGGKGPHATTLTWRELKPLLRPSFALTSR